LQDDPLATVAVVIPSDRGDGRFRISSRCFASYRTQCCDQAGPLREVGASHSAEPHTTETIRDFLAIVNDVYEGGDDDRNVSDDEAESVLDQGRNDDLDGAVSED